MNYVPIVFDIDELEYLIKCVRFEIEEACVDLEISQYPEPLYSEIKQSIEERKKFLEKLRYFYRHYKIKGRD